jgi:ATP-binding cassette subfamily C protein
VSQDGTLLSGTIRANLLWANPDADEEAMREAPELAAAPEFVGSLPDGLDTVVGERGALFSGGERQRLTLACALVRRPDLLVLDEATSTLDSANEGRVLEALRGFRGRMTVLIISHLPSAVGEADVIHVLEEGRWVESGSWDELTALDSGRFSQMARAQGVVS